MVCVGSVNRGRTVLNHHDAFHFCNGWLKPGICASILLIGATACAGATGPGIGIKVGAQTLTDPVTLDKTTRARLDLEVSSPMVADEHLDFALNVGGLSLGSFHDYYTDVVDDTIIEESYTDRLSVLDVRVMARLYPLGNHGWVRPYLGAGLGYFWLLDDWEDEYVESFPDPVHPDEYHTTVTHDEGVDTLAHGFFSFIVLGATVPIGDNGELIFEFQHDYGKQDGDYDVGGPIYMFGARFRF